MNPRYDRWLYLFFSSLGCCLMLAAAYSYFAPMPSAAVDVALSDIEIPDGYVHEKREVVFQLENHSSQSIRVLGLAEC